MPATAVLDLERLAGKWIAEIKGGEVVAADSLDELEVLLIQKHGYSEDNLPAIRHLPEEGSGSFLL